MIVESDVWELHQQTAQTLRRSYLLLEERGASRSSAGDSPGQGGENFSLQLSTLTCSDYFPQLVHISSLTDTLDAAAVLIPRLQRELHSPSLAVVKQRSVKGFPYPLARKVVDHISPPTSSEMRLMDESLCSCWGGAVDGEGESEATNAVLDSRGLPMRGGGGWGLVSSLLTAAIGTDTTYLPPDGGESARERGASWLISHAAALFPADAGHQHLFLEQIIYLHHQDARSEGWKVVMPLLLGCGALSLVHSHFIAPLRRKSRELLAAYFHGGPTDFERASTEYVQLLLGGLPAVSRRLVACTSSSSPISAQQQTRLLELLKSWVDAALEGLEKECQRSSRGLAEALQPLVSKVGAEVEEIILTNGGNDEQRGQVESNTIASGREILAATLRTMVYRLWMVVETEARAELGELGGAEHAAHISRKRNRLLLQHSGGKLTIPLIRSVAEDHDVLLKETSSQSPSGHTIYQLHRGARSLFLYVESGLPFFLVGKQRRAGEEYRLAHSVEELFQHFADERP